MRRSKKSPITTRTWIIIGALGGGAFVALALILLVAGLLIWRFAVPDRSGPFKSRMKEYTEKHWVPSGKPESKYPAPKWVVVDMVHGQLDDLHFKLPSDLRAAGPDEVRTLVRVSRGTRTIATQTAERSGNFVRYRSTGIRETEECEVWVIDCGTGTVLANHTFSGPKGQKPSDAEVLEYLLSLLPKAEKEKAKKGAK